MASARILLTLIVLHLTAVQPLLAAPITINFSGVLTDPFQLPDQGPAGTVVTGPFTYDPAAPDTNTDGDLVAGLAGDAELGAPRRHLLAVEPAGDEPKTLVHGVTLLPRHAPSS